MSKDYDCRNQGRNQGRLELNSKTGQKMNGARSLAVLARQGPRRSRRLWPQGGTVRQWQIRLLLLDNRQNEAVGTGADGAVFGISVSGGIGLEPERGATGVQLADWLGTIRASYSYTGGAEGQSQAHAPFGESYAWSGGYPTGFAGQRVSAGDKVAMGT